MFAAVHNTCISSEMSHNHAHDHGHAHAPASFGRAFAIGIVLNTAFVAVEFGYGLVSNSMALIADAGHNFSDVLGLAVAWFASVIATRPPSATHTYGYKGTTILAALANAIFLLVAMGAIGWEAIQRFAVPEPAAGRTVMIVAAIGIGINALTAWLFASGSKQDLNIRGAYLHMASDAAVSAGVVAAGFIMLQTGWLWIDPLVSLVIAAIVIWGTWSLLRDSFAMSLQAVPPGVDLKAVEAFLASRPGVSEVHDLHVWAMSTTETAMTAHLVMPIGRPDDKFLMHVTDELQHHHGIGHVTLQIETDPGTVCKLQPAHVV
jgi:cobalt-zinc-cadmium efflux system protein